MIQEMADEGTSAIAVGSAGCPDVPSVQTAAEEKGQRRRWLRRRSRLLVLGLVLLLLTLSGVVAGRRLLAVYHLKAGRALLERYHQEEARPHLQASLRLWPGTAETLLLLARAARRDDATIAEAEEHLEHYRRLHGQTEEWVLERMLHAAAKGDTDRVLKRLHQLVQEDSPATPLILEAMIQGYFRTYRYAEVQSVLQLWLERQPDHTQALFYHAMLDSLLQRRQEAVGNYERILQFDPAHDAARHYLAMLLVGDKKFPEALAHLQQLRQRNSDNPMVAVLLARCLDHLDQQDQAEQLLEEVLARNPHFSPAVAERGQLALRRGQADQAESWLREASRLDATNSLLRYHFVQCLYRQGKTAEAEEEQRRLDQLEANLTHLHEITTKEMPRRSQDPILHQELGQALLAVGLTEQGKYWLRRAVRENPSNASARRALADSYRRTGDVPTQESPRHLLSETPINTQAEPRP